MATPILPIAGGEPELVAGLEPDELGANLRLFERSLRGANRAEPTSTSTC